MATSTKKKLTPLERVEKSLNAAAKILNKKIHHPDIDSLIAEPKKFVLYQVWCDSEQKVITPPSMDKDALQIFSSKHDTKHGHTSWVVGDT